MQAKNIYATGRRKRSVARVWVKEGNGTITVNKKPISEYFGRKTLELIVKQPMEHLSKLESYDIFTTVKGGGWSGQAGAIKLGIARCLVQIDESNRKKLREVGFMTRDSRSVERKKYGRKKARKRFQFSKR